jgi:putative ABC transport system permease protein
MGTLSRDVRYAARLLGRNPGFTLVAALTLALGIGANTAIFSLMNAMVLRPLSVKDPDKLVVISEARLKGRGQREPTMATFVAWRKYSHTLQDIARGDFYGGPETLSGIGRAEQVFVAYCTQDFLSLLGVKAFRGRLFLPEDLPKGESETVVISESLWQRTFSADPNILGQTVSLEGSKKTIVGILPAGFSVLPWNMHTDAWVAFNPGGSPQLRWMAAIGRLKPGVSMAQAQAELSSIAKGVEQAHPETDRDWSIRVQSVHEWLVGWSRRYFYLLLGAVGFILLIACANVANLLLARGAVRQKEISIRAALGAGRWRLIRQLLAESMLLALVGGALGVLVGFWGTRVLVSFAPVDEIRSLTVHVDITVLGFTLATSLLTGILFGLMPAFRASKSDLHGSLKEGGRQSGAGVRQRSQSLLLVSEVALGVVLLVGAGLLINSFLRLQKVNLGYNRKNVLRGDVLLAGSKYWHNTPGSPGSMKTVTPQGALFFQQVLERVQTVPGVVSAGISHLAPPGDVQQRSFRIIGKPVATPGQEPRAGFSEVSGSFFRTLEIPLVKGRYVADRDAEGSPWVVDINEAMARRFFPNEDPIGKMVQTTILSGQLNMNAEESRPREIVGVVGDVRHFGFGSDPFPIMYGSYHQHVSDYPGGYYIGHLWKSFVIRTKGDPMALVAPLQKIVAEVDKDQPVFGIQSLEQGLSDSVSFERFQMRLFGIFGGLGLALAAVGIYGVMSYLVTHRTHEIGVRVALGAGRGDVLRLVIFRGMRTAVIGLVIGVAASLALTRLIAGFLFGVKNTDPVTYTIVALVLMTVALVACYVPARRATKVDPLVALRHE